jgi:adenylate kinase
VPDNVAYDIVARRLLEQDCVRGFVLDGFPRTVMQARWLDAFLEQDFSPSSRWRRRVPIIILIHVDRDSLLLRLTGRRVCPVCGRIYNIYLQPPRMDELCDADGSKLMRRDDDREEVIRERLSLYDQERIYSASGDPHTGGGTRTQGRIVADRPCSFPGALKIALYLNCMPWKRS